MKKSNVHYLSTALVATSFLASSPSYALGIGQIKLQSALNQSLKAEIALTLSEGEKVNDFKIGFASNAKFDEAGIPWSVFLSKIKFETVTKNGKTFITLSSTEAFKEPFLDFLLEIKGAKGSLYREFTVLVDPPEIAQAVKTLRPSVAMTGESSYGPVRESETLWSIAKQFNERNQVSVSQMVSAIYTANPDAFNKIDDKTAILIPGKILQIPNLAASAELLAPIKTKPAAHRSAIKPALIPEKSMSNEISAPVVTAESKIMQQKIVEFEQKLSTMQKAIAEVAFEQKLSAMQKIIVEKNAQIAALKSSINGVNPVEKSPIIPPVPLTTPQISSPKISPTIEIASQPAPILSPATLPAEKISAPVGVIPSAPAPGNYLGMPAELYYYIAGGAGLSLFGVIGWLRLRKQDKPKTVVTSENSFTPESNWKENQGGEMVMNSQKTFDNSFTTKFNNDDFGVANAADFDELSEIEFKNMVDVNSDARNTNGVLSKADVYLSYGNYGQAEKLLYDEFIKYPETHDYALRLLKIYVSQDSKSKFKDFVLRLVKLGKNELPEFWTLVSDLASDFYPEALFFPPAMILMPDSLTSIPFDGTFASKNATEKFENDFDFSSMNFDDSDDSDDEKITSNELSENERLKKATDNVLPSLDFDMFEINESLDAEIRELEKFILEKPTEEESLDFGVFEMSESLEAETLTFRADDIELKMEPVSFQKLTDKNDLNVNSR